MVPVPVALVIPAVAMRADKSGSCAASCGAGSPAREITAKFAASSTSG